MSSTILVSYTLRHKTRREWKAIKGQRVDMGPLFVDHWLVAVGMEDAKTIYNDLVNETCESVNWKKWDLYIANICGVIQSTDYI